VTVLIVCKLKNWWICRRVMQEVLEEFHQELLANPIGILPISEIYQSIVRRMEVTAFSSKNND
jgi:hypothetical protein